MRHFVIAAMAVALMGCPAPDGHVYSASSPDASAKAAEALQPVLDRYEFDGALRISGGALDSVATDRGYSWPWASVTKQVVATLVMQEVAAGRLVLDRPVSEYVDGWPQDGMPAPSLRHLLRHQSGLFDPEDDPGFQWEGALPLDPMMCAARRAKAPGGEFNYTNCDTLLVGLVLERRTGRPLAALFNDRIAGPSGMERTGFVAADTLLAPSRAGIPASLIAHYGAAGGLAGPLADMIRFDRALLAGKLLPNEAREEMWRGDPSLGYSALGQWETVLSLDGCEEPVRIIERRGAIKGYQARNFIIPQKGISIAMAIARSEDDYSFGEPWSGEGLSFGVLSAAACAR